jgi:hypothetical protein
MRIGSGRAILALFATVLVTNAIVFPRLAGMMGRAAGTTTFLPLDLRFLYAPAEAHAALESLGADGRRLYAIVELSVDVVYPLAYGLLFYLLIRWFAARSTPTRSLDAASRIPLAAMALDWLENVFILAMIATFPARSDSLARVASGVTAIKLLCFALSIGLVLYAATRWLLSRRRGRAPTSP